MASRTKNKLEKEVISRNGFTKMRVTCNLSMPCFRCEKKSREFYWKPIPGKITEIYCVDCYHD